MLFEKRRNTVGFDIDGQQLFEIIRYFSDRHRCLRARVQVDYRCSLFDGFKHALIRWHSTKIAKIDIKKLVRRIQQLFVNLYAVSGALDLVRDNLETTYPSLRRADLDQRLGVGERGRLVTHHHDHLVRTR